MSPDEPLVTIVTPVLNRADHIGLCLASVRGQTYPHIEHVVVDGGSTDGTLDVIRAFDRDELRVLTGRDEGMYDAINKGLAIARGEVLAYLNSDDFLFPWAVEATLASLAHGYDISYGDMIVINTIHRSTSLLLAPPRFNPGWHAYVGTLSQPTVFWRRELTDRAGPFDTSYRLVADCEYWLRLASLGARFRHSGDVIACQIDHPGTLRAIHPDLLSAEFARLRAQYRPLIGRPPSRMGARIRRSILWRTLMCVLMLRLSGVVGGHRWKYLTGAVRRGEVRANPVALVGSLLPLGLRPRSIAPFDIQPIVEALMRPNES